MEERDPDEVILNILRYSNQFRDNVGGDVLTADEVLEFRDSRYGSYGYEELKGLTLTIEYVESQW